MATGCRLEDEDAIVTLGVSRAEAVEALRVPDNRGEPERAVSWLLDRQLLREATPAGAAPPPAAPRHMRPWIVAQLQPQEPRAKRAERAGPPGADQAAWQAARKTRWPGKSRRHAGSPDATGACPVCRKGRGVCYRPGALGHLPARETAGTAQQKPKLRNFMHGSRLTANLIMNERQMRMEQPAPAPQEFEPERSASATPPPPPPVAHNTLTTAATMAAARGAARDGHVPVHTTLWNSLTEEQEEEVAAAVAAARAAAAEVSKMPSWHSCVGFKLGQLQPFIAVFPHKCMGQLASFGPT
jgi:hypothetical protein